MSKTLISRLWSNITELKVLLNGNPHIAVAECKTVLGEMEQKVKRLRLREIKAQR
jgi:predicted aconitase